METDTLVGTVAVLGTVVGLAVLLAGVAAHEGGRPLQYAGGAVVIASIGVMTAYLEGLPDAEGGGH